MKKPMIFLLGLCAVTEVWAADPNFDTKSRVVTFPRVTVDESTAYTDVQLLLNLDGTWNVITYQHEVDNQLYLTGNWRGEAELEANFSAPMPCIGITEIILNQRGKQLTGLGALTRLCEDWEEKTIFHGFLEGAVDGNNISFEISTQQGIISYNGTVSTDLQKLILRGPSIFISSFASSNALTWTLTLEN